MLTASDKLEIMLREGSFLVGVGGSLVALLGLMVQVSASDYSQMELFASAAFIVLGLFMVYQSVEKHKVMWAIAADARLVTGRFEISRTTAKEIDGTTFYLIFYSYQFEESAYAHCVETNFPEKYGEQESIFIQRSQPANAVFATDLPSVVRAKLLSAVST
ncbi:hypothetical protein [Hymenobacter sp. IS2118]|uniref:hypothetical protein n=1 Tax=Hymenobacter sp. IS2118 TaxID=1505605 RepID=UPI0005591B0B|nr:hypothetical protein [Hymenobacter sp. IS2118]